MIEFRVDNAGDVYLANDLEVGAAGVALAAIQALIAENTELRARLEALERQQAQMQAVMARVMEWQADLQPVKTALT